MVNSKEKKVLGIPKREHVPTQNYAQSSAASIPIVGGGYMRNTSLWKPIGGAMKSLIT